MNRPEGWSSAALVELKTKLLSADEHFTIENLQKVHELHYHKALVDIISMVKHAMLEREPLYTAEERANNAFERITFGKRFSDEQRQWLNRIKEHLITNLSIDKEDFNNVPIFTRAGGWRKANRIFENRLPDLLTEFNEAIAA